MGKMGYKNLDAVIECAGNRRMHRPRGENISFDPMAFSVLTYMALNVYDWPPTARQRASHTACRVYSLGWGSIVKKLGLDALAKDQLMDREVDEVKDLEKARWDAAIIRVSNASKFLQEQGLIKLLRKADIRNGYNADWILLIGSPSENKQVEDWAKECLPYMKRVKSVRSRMVENY